MGRGGKKVGSTFLAHSQREEKEMGNVDWYFGCEFGG